MGHLKDMDASIWDFMEVETAEEKAAREKEQALIREKEMSIVKFTMFTEDGDFTYLLRRGVIFDKFGDEFGYDITAASLEEIELFEAKYGVPDGKEHHQLMEECIFLS